MALAADGVTFIDLLMLNLSGKFKINLLTIDYTECFTQEPVVDPQTETSGEHTLARDLLKEVTGAGYNRIRAGFINDTNIGESILPTLHHLNKSRQLFNSGTYYGNTDTGSSTAATGGTTSTCTSSTTTSETGVHATVTNGTTTTSTTNTTSTTTNGGSSSSTTPPPTVGTNNTLKIIDDIFVSVKTTDNNQNVKKVAKILTKQKGYLMAKIEQGYEHYLKLMLNKFVLRRWKVRGNMLVIDSYNGAVHSSTNTKDSGIVSYSILLLHPDYFAHRVSSASSSCILTWINLLTGESWETLFPLLILIYTEQQLLRSKASFQDGSNFWYYQMHDAKFVYTITAHVGWSSVKLPFLL